jgi:hypothetical protein
LFLLQKTWPKNSALQEVPPFRLRLGGLPRLSMPSQKEEAMTPDPKKFAAAKRRLLKGLPKIIADLQQQIRDIESWNDNRVDERPFDCESHRVALMHARDILRCVKADKRIDPAKWKAMTESLGEPI